MITSSFSPALTFIRRDLRLPEIRLLLLALIVAVTAVSSVGFFTDRVDRAMRQQATALFGADLLIQSTRPVSDAYDDLATQLGLQTARTIEFPSVVLSGENSLLSQIRAVSPSYPLRGQPETSLSLEETGKPTDGAPAVGEVWVEANVLHSLSIDVGDSIDIGQLSFRVSRILTFVADNGGSPFQLAPRILMPIEQLQETGLLSPASRASFRFLVAGETNAVKQFQSDISERLAPSEELQNAEQGRPEITAALDRASRFMALASIMTVVLSGAAIALATFSFAKKESRNVAILKSLGSTRRKLYWDNLKRFFFIVTIATSIGALLGFTAQFALAELLSDWVNVDLPPASFMPVLSGFFTALLTLGGFGLPSLMRLVKTPPMQIFRSELGNQFAHVWFSLLPIVGAVYGFLIWQAGEIKLASLIFVGILIALLLMLSIARVMTWLLKRFPIHAGKGWLIGIRNIGRFPNRSSLLIVTFGIAVLTLSLLGSVRQDLMNSWQSSVPDSAPNHFLINIQQHELSKLEAFLNQRGIDDFSLYPMIRARLVAINEHAVSADDYEEPRAKRLVSREFNLSSTDQLPTANKVVAGSWQSTSKQNELSVEVEIAETLGMSIGDMLTFDVAGQQFIREIGNLRAVKWDSMQPNFFVIAPPATVENYPTTYITSLHVDNTDSHFITDLVREFSSVTVLDVRAILAQVRRIIGQASSAVEYVFSFTLLAGVVVLLAAVQTQRQERRQEIAILKTLGSGHSKIRQAIISEFLCLGLLAGLLGSLLAIAVGWLLASYVFELEYQINAALVSISVVITGILLAFLGMQVTRKLINTRPTALLRD